MKLEKILAPVMILAVIILGALFSVVESMDIPAGEFRDIDGIKFVMTDYDDTYTLSAYNAQNYRMYLYDGEEVIGTYKLSDVDMVIDSSLTTSQWVPYILGGCAIKTTNEMFVGQLLNEHFVNMSDEQVNFVLSYLFRKY